MTITVDNLMLRRDGAALFSGLSFEAQAGQTVCIDGRSGSGKSTLLKALVGFVTPDAGQIVIGGEELTGKSVWHLRRKIAYVSQEPDLGQGSALDCVRRPFGYHANAHLTWDEQTVKDYCDLLHLPHKLLGRDMAELSGGEKQRIAFIIALLLDRPILLLDEPISALDKHSKAAFKELLATESSRTVLFVSHDDMLLEIADIKVDLETGGAHA